MAEKAMAERFMDALQQVEREQVVEPLVALFAGDAVLERSTGGVSHEAREGARAFWQEYLARFQQVRSTFSHVIASDGGAAMEWEATGTLAGGQPITYRGVSIIEHDGQQVRHFRTYYDTAAFVSKDAAASEDRGRTPHGGA